MDFLISETVTAKVRETVEKKEGISILSPQKFQEYTDLLCWNWSLGNIEVILF